MRNLLSVAAVLLAGCATAEPQPPVVGAGPFVCREFATAEFVGRGASTELGAQLQRASGARSLRWIQPGMSVTMDFREDRLNVRLDEQKRVLSASCG